MYAGAVDRLLGAGQAYACVCTRKEVELAARAPHAEDGAGGYPGASRGRCGSVAAAREGAGRTPAVRFEMPAGEVAFVDEFQGPRRFDVGRELGDFVILK